MIIYQAINIINNISYIGKTVQNFEKYKKTHIRSALNKYDIKRGKSRYFYNAIRKYGVNNFKWKILYECDNKKELNEKEKYYIHIYNTYLHGYNLTKGGDGNMNGGIYERTSEIRKKISLSLIGHKRSKKSIEKQIQTNLTKVHPLYKKEHTKESIEKMSNNSKGKRNAASKKWTITSPNGIIYEIIGGFHQFLKKHNLSRWSMDKVYKNEKNDYKGWKVKRLNVS